MDGGKFKVRLSMMISYLKINSIIKRFIKQCDRTRHEAIACRNAPILEYFRDRKKVAVGVGFPHPYSRMIRLTNVRSRYFISSSDVARFGVFSLGEKPGFFENSQKP
jgi:hypothetical protein